MVHKGFVRFLVLFMVFSFLLAPLPIATSRRLKSEGEKLLVLQDLRSHEDAVVVSADGQNEFGEGYVEGRMDLERNDYPGTGANNHHDPKTPGRD